MIPGPPAVQRVFELTGTNALFDFEPEPARAHMSERC